MLKQVKRNKRLDWRSSRYSRPFKLRAAIKRAKCSAVLAQGAAMMRLIASTSVCGNGFLEASKASAMASVATETAKAFISALKENPK